MAPVTAAPLPLAVDTTWQRLDATTVLGGSPVRLFRTSTAGARVLDAIERGEPLPDGHRALTDRLLAAGAVHPRTTGTPPAADALAAVTVVVPTYGEPAAAVAGMLRDLAPVHAIVVDDGSPTPLDPASVGRRVLRLADNRGPAAARNAGLAAVTTPFVLFLDADASIERTALQRMLQHLADERVAAVAPRVLPPAAAAGALGRYEAARSPLDMGPEPALVRAGTRVSYVPAAALLCRVDAVRGVGGFDEALRYGEDVDLVWRLAAAGWAVRYEPEAAARHAVRRSLGAALRQRFHYGTAAGPLERRHRGALAPVRISRWGAGAWAAAATGHPAAAAGVAITGGVRLARQLAGPTGAAPVGAVARVSATGHLHAGRQLADALTGVWWPATIAAAVLSRRARRVLVAAAVVPAMAEWLARRPRIDPVRYLLLRTLDRAAYGTGVIAGALSARSAGPLRPSIE